MKIRPIFFNQSNNLRAGWRIGIFLLLVFTLTNAIGRILVYFFRVHGEIVQGIFYVLILVSTFVVLKVIDHRPLHSVGLPFHSRLGIEIVQGLLLSFLMISAVFLAEYLLGYIHITWRGLSLSTIGVSLSTMLLVFLWFGFGEELLFRGYLFQTLIEGSNKYIAIILLSVLFGSAHIGNPNVSVLAVINTILAGIWLSVAYLKTRTLWFPTALHATWNFFQGYVYSFPVSGLNLENRSLFFLQQLGPNWITGGSYGPEGGILTSIVVFVATIFILKSPAIKIGEGVWTHEPQLHPHPLTIDSRI